MPEQEVRKMRGAAVCNWNYGKLAGYVSYTQLTIRDYLTNKINQQTDSFFQSGYHVLS